MKVAVIGLGKLGLSMAVAIAGKGVQVFGVERDRKRRHLIQKGRSPIDEPGIQEKLPALLKEGSLLLCDYGEAVSETEAAFVAVNTPESSRGKMNTRDLEDCVAKIGEELRKQPRFYIIAVNSTVLPETTEFKLKPLLEKRLGKKVGHDFGLAANPVFIALTTVIRDFLNPPVVVIGASDPKTSDWLAAFYNKICENQPPILKTAPTMAEVIKLAHNAYCTSKMAFINEVADLCARVPGGDIRKVEEFFSKGGERAGKFLRAGLGFGGPCFPRDLRFFLKYTEGKKLKTPLLNSVERSNREHARELVRQIQREAGSLEGKKVAVLGLSYKPGIKNFEDSFSFRLIEELEKKRARISAYDPLQGPGASKNGMAPALASKKVLLKKNLRQALKGTDLCIVAHASKEFQNIRKIAFPRTPPPHFFDPWGVLSD